MHCPIERSFQLSIRSKTRGACTGIVGCKVADNLRARNLTPATAAPGSDVGCSGTRWPLQTTAKRESAVIPDSFTWIRSSEESTLRTVPPEAVSSARTFHGSSARRSSSSTPSTWIDPILGKRNSRCSANHSSSKLKPDCRKAPSTSKKSSRTKCGSMNRSWSAVPQRIRLPSNGSFQNMQTKARINNICRRFIRAVGGISNARNSSKPSGNPRPCGGKSLSTQNSARCVFPVTSASKFRNNPSTTEGGQLPEGR